MNARTLIEAEFGNDAETERHRANTPEQVKSAARDHVAYQWTRRHRSGWSDEQRSIYDREYDQTRREEGSVVGRARPLYRGWMIIGDATDDTKWEASRHGLKLRGDSETAVQRMVDQRIRADSSGKMS